MIYLLWIASLFLLYCFMERKKKKRIGELNDLIDKIKNLDYQIPMKQDDFSILEDKIYKLFIEIVHTREVSSENSRKQIEYLEDIAHQIKTPITGMLFSLENLKKEASQNESINVLERQLIRLNSLSDILLKLSCLDANKQLMKKDFLSIGELVDYALDNLNLKNGTYVQIDQSVNENFIYGDFYWLSESLINILKNAAGRPGCNNIYIRSEKNPLYVSLEIEDDGGGIQKDSIKNIFKRFYKTPDSDGFGIGLAIAKSAVENNSGDINVRNTERGALFEIKFYNITEKSL